MNLMMSIRTLELSPTKVRTGKDIPYVEIHNEGGTITVTAQMKKFWWAKYCKFAGIKKYLNEKTSCKTPKPLNAKAKYCRNMALMKVGSKIRIPQRKFIGESKTLMDQLDAWLIAEIDTVQKIV